MEAFFVPRAAGNPTLMANRLARVKNGFLSRPLRPRMPGMQQRVNPGVVAAIPQHQSPEIT